MKYVTLDMDVKSLEDRQKSILSQLKAYEGNESAPAQKKKAKWMEELKQVEQTHFVLTLGGMEGKKS